MLAIVDCGSSNLHSVAKSCLWVIKQQKLDTEVQITNDPEIVAKADRVILPGVGAFGDCMAGLNDVNGLIETLYRCVIVEGIPLLGICVGMQILATCGYEHGKHSGLGWINGKVVKIAPEGNLKIPHMGWNTIRARRHHELLNDIPTGDDGLHGYFVHSFHFLPENYDHLLATADYGGELTAIIASNNIAGTQFHPEKSQRLGLQLITNFLRWRP